MLLSERVENSIVKSNGAYIPDLLCVNLKQLLFTTGESFRWFLFELIHTFELNEKCIVSHSFMKALHNEREFVAEFLDKLSCEFRLISVFHWIPNALTSEI